MEIPISGATSPERADAARNRRLLLTAALALIEERGPDALSMEAVAERAGVGKGTLFRRFGNREGLLFAILDESEREFQHSFMYGTPPLGPGAQPVDRLVAFGRSWITRRAKLEGEIWRSAIRDSRGRFRSAPYQVAFTHVSLLIRQSGYDGNIRWLSDALLSAIEPSLVLFQLREVGLDIDDIADGWERLVRGSVGSNP